MLLLICKPFKIALCVTWQKRSLVDYITQFAACQSKVLEISGFMWYNQN